MSKYHPQSATLSTILGALRAQGKTIVLANGCFDLLHVGHVRFLIDAKTRADYLVVALNSDASVRENKGAERPIVSADERAEVLAALECIDYVTVFGEKTADNILKALRPTLHAKGTDYDPKQVPESETLKALGIQTVICGDPKDHSTRDLLKKLRSPATPAGSDSPELSMDTRIPAKDVQPQPKKAASPKPAGNKSVADESAAVPTKKATTKGKSSTKA